MAQAAGRLVTLLLHIRGERWWSARAIANELGWPKNRAQRHLQAATAAGWPIERCGDVGRGFRYRWRGEFVTPTPKN